MRERIYAGTQEGLKVWSLGKAGYGEIPVTLRDTVDAIDGPRSRPEIVYVAAAHQGICRTQDAGTHWDCMFRGTVRAITVDPSDECVVYAGTEPIHLYRSEDRGVTWEELRGLQALPAEVRRHWTYPRPPHREHVRHIFVSPENPHTLYLCLEHGGIVRSLDRGITWEDVSQGIDYRDIHHIGCVPGGAGLMFVATAQGFFVSPDPATGWTRAEHGMTRDYFHDFVFLPGDPPVLMVATADKSPGYWDRPERAQGAMFRSRNLAKSWERIGVGHGLQENMQQMVWALTQHPEDPSKVYAGLGAVSRGRSADPSQKGAGDILVTEDEGHTWQRLPLELAADRVLWVAVDA